jgi:hypothetical protein
VINIFKDRRLEVESEESPIIQFPADLPKEEKNSRLEALKRKLVVYDARIDSIRSAHPYKHPLSLKLGTAGAPAQGVDAHMKRFVLAKFLENAEHGVNAWELCREYTAELGIEGFDETLESHWNNACAVIDDYVNTGGANISGESSGLR